MIVRVVLVSLLLSLASCSAAKRIFTRGGSEDRAGLHYSEFRPNESARIVEVQVKRSQMLEVLKNQNLNRARLVPVFSHDGPASYRLFDVQPGSVFSMLGLSNADMVLAADDFVISSWTQFFEFLSVLPQEKEANIRIRRAGEIVLLNIKVLE